MTVHVGTSGWSYDHWNGALYPPGTPAGKRLEIYVRHFDTVELNASFYRWPSNDAFARLRQRLPEEFMLSVKAPRGLTHGKRLYEPEAWLGRLTSGWHELADRRGVLLVQLAPSHARDDDRLEYFLAQLPGWLPAAVEFRHPSWHDEAVFGLLERHRAAYCVMSGANLPCVLRATAPFVYVRLHGPDPSHLYGGSYDSDALRWWAERIAEWDRGGHDVYVYFNNDVEGHAVHNARRLRELVSGRVSA